MFKILIYISLIVTISALHEDTFKSVEELIKKYGYPFEHHSVPTADGYNLGIHRIPHGLENEGQSGKKVILIMHQFLTSSADFVSTGNSSLGFLLADKNYDVWLGNARGNTHSRSHTSLNPDDDAEFWSFILDDVGTIDLPTIIDFIISKTGEEQIYYIGHGQGSTIFYIMASKMSEYNDKIKLMAALAPMAYMESMPNPLFRILDTLLLPISTIIPFNLKNVLEALLGSEGILERLGIIINEIFKNSADGTFARLCDDDSALVELCAAFISIIYGFDSTQLERSKIPVILTNAYAGSSYKQLSRYLDFYYNDKFGKQFNLSQVKVPNGIFYGTNDWLVSTKDIDHLACDLQDSVVLKYEIPFKDFNHIDFLFAKDVKKLAYDRLFEFLESEEKEKLELDCEKN